jgi:putative aldouronate transport system permease protein
MITTLLGRGQPRKSHRISQLPLHLMLLPGIISVFIFNYIPMAGVIIAFQRFVPAKGLFGNQKWVGLNNFRMLFMLPDTMIILRNTVFIASMKMIGGIVVPVTAALMLNEVKNKYVKRSMQTLIYLPNFLSWVIFGGILMDILALNGGIVNRIIEALGGKPIYFLGNAQIFPYVVVTTDIWKGFGFSTIVYFAALSNIDPTQYEAAGIDGAKRYQCVWHITLPGIRSTIVLLATLSLGNILNAGFEQIFVLYSPQVYSTGDIIDTFVYRMGLIDAQYSLATATGLMKSIVSIMLILVSYYLAYRLADYRIF